MTINDNQTICAIATAMGGAIGVVRVSGPKAIATTNQLFLTKSGKHTLLSKKANTVTFGRIVDPKGEVVDEVLVSLFRAPHSYTGEDSVEISCHGSSYILQRVVQLLIEYGCRQAEPGEYTMRAFLNGKMDLSQAEAVADVIASSSDAYHRMAINQMRGTFSQELSLLREQLLHLTSLIELELDFSDHEELEFADRKELLAITDKVEQTVDRLAASFKLGNAIKNGVPVAIIGETNAGKSTLLNTLVGEDKAIVSDIKGTTRDVIEDTMNIKGTTFRFIDTAGIRDTRDEIEAQGIERTFKKIQQAEIIVWLIDATSPVINSQMVHQVLPLCEDKTLILAYNKSDLASTLPHTLPPKFPASTKIIAISAKEGKGIKELIDILVSFTSQGGYDTCTSVVSNMRHYNALKDALSSIRRVQVGLTNHYPTDLVSQDLRETLDHLSEITGGEITTPEVLNNIFSRFCIGK